jgi:hypothetical protein
MGLALVCSGGVKLPLKGPRFVLIFSMLFSEHLRDIASVDPSSRLMRAISIVGKLAGSKWPG